MCGCNLVTPRLSRRPAQHLRQLGDVDGDASGLVAGQQLRRRAPTGLFLEIDVGERLLAAVADDEGPPIQLGVGLLDGPGRREAVLSRIAKTSDG